MDYLLSFFLYLKLSLYLSITLNTIIIIYSLYNVHFNSKIFQYIIRNFIKKRQYQTKQSHTNINQSNPSTNHSTFISTSTKLNDNSIVFKNHHHSQSIDQIITNPLSTSATDPQSSFRTIYQHPAEPEGLSIHFEVILNTQTWARIVVLVHPRASVTCTTAAQCELPSYSNNGSLCEKINNDSYDTWLSEFVCFFNAKLFFSCNYSNLIHICMC